MKRILLFATGMFVVGAISGLIAITVFRYSNSNPDYPGKTVCGTRNLETRQFIDPNNITVWIEQEPLHLDLAIYVIDDTKNSFPILCYLHKLQSLRHVTTNPASSILVYNWRNNSVLFLSQEENLNDPSKELLVLFMAGENSNDEYVIHGLEWEDTSVAINDLRFKRFSNANEVLVPTVAPMWEIFGLMDRLTSNKFSNVVKKYFNMMEV